MVLDRLRAKGLKVKLEKCVFFCERVRYLGHVISVQGVEADPSKVEAIVQWPRPGVCQLLQAFCGGVLLAVAPAYVCDHAPPTMGPVSRARRFFVV